MHRIFSALPPLLAALLLLTGCRTAQSAQGESDEAGSSGGQVVHMSDVDDMGYASIEDVLISRVAGVRRDPDGSGIIIRGPRSLQGSNEPLYVVDGIPSQFPPQLNLHDVAEIEVLKDAAALSRFGSRGMHGVVLIRTKKAE